MRSVVAILALVVSARSQFAIAPKAPDSSSSPLLVPSNAAVPVAVPTAVLVDSTSVIITTSPVTSTTTSTTSLSSISSSRSSSATSTSLTTTLALPGPLVPVIPLTDPARLHKFSLGVWLDDPDSPGEWNAKFGRKFPSFEAAQSIPYNVTSDGEIRLDPDPSMTATFLSNVQTWNDGTNASVLMTIYADQTLTFPNGTVLEGFDLVTDVAITHLATRLNQIIDQTGREVYMRWLPEMNGSWMKYGLQPARYVEVWIRMFGIFRQIAPRVKLVWSPNYDLRDPSYWPGPQYVDWIGSSCYWKGWGVNALIDQSYPMETVSYVYNTYAVPYNFPFMITEASAAWESGPGVSPITGESFAHVTNQVTQAVLQQSFWSGILAHEVLLQYPLLRAAYIFEVAKQEEFFTDFRVSNDSVTLTTFELLISAADAMGDLEWANVTVRSTSTTRTTTSTTTRLTTSSEILPTVVTVYSKAIPTLVSPTTNVATRFSDSSLVFMLCTVLAQLSFV